MQAGLIVITILCPLTLLGLKPMKVPPSEEQIFFHAEGTKVRLAVG